MFKNKKLLILIGVAIVFFGASFGISMIFIGSAKPKAAKAQQATSADSLGWDMVREDIKKNRPIEQELEVLIKELRHKTSVLKQKEKALEQRAKRMDMTEDMLKQQAQELDLLRSRLATPLNELKEERRRLLQALIRITKTEADNLKKIAAKYQSMDTSSGAAIILAMWNNNQRDDAVKILHLMEDRRAGKILAEIPDRKLAALLFSEMKRIDQEN